MRWKKSIKKCYKLPWRMLKRYLSQSSIHGLKYFVQDGCHWSERLFWLICCGLSWWGCSEMVYGVITVYGSRPVATTLETNHLLWKARLPSLYFCTQDVPKSKNYTSHVWPKIGPTYKLMDIISWGYLNGLVGRHDSKSFEGYANMSAMKCEMMFERCIWSDENFNCCEAIVPMWTPVGPCLVFNSIHTGVKYEFVRKVGSSGLLTLYVKTGPYFNFVTRHFTFYFLGMLELPSILSSSQIKIATKWMTSEMQLDVLQVPTYNEDGVRKISVDKRHCRFSNEVEDLSIYKSYSYDACLAEDMIRRMLQYCGCVTHIVRRASWMPICDYDGLACIVNHGANLTSSVNVSCSADCEEIGFTFYTNFLREKTSPIIHVNLLFGPTLRYRRYIVRSNIDIVVAVGSAVGLFVGASVLSLVEIPYWFIVRGLDNDDEDDETGNRGREKSHHQ